MVPKWNIKELKRFLVVFFGPNNIFFIDILSNHGFVSMESPKRDPFPSYNFVEQNFLKMITFSQV